MNNKGVLWVRVSTEDQKGGYSPEAQLHELKLAAEKENIKIVKIFNVAESASAKAKRREFNAMMNFATEQDISFIIAYETDRLTRNIDDLSGLHRFIKNDGKKIFLVKENRILDKKSIASDKLLLNILGVVSTFETELRGEKTKKGMEAKARVGGLPCRAPIGYLNVPDTTDPLGRRRTVIIDPDRAPIIKKVFELYKSGRYSMATLGDELSRLGLKSKPSKKRPSMFVTKHGLQTILKDPFYYGCFKWNKVLWKGNHEPIISKQLFDEVQVKLQEKCSNSKSDTKKWFAFKPFLKCGYCESSITAEIQHGHHKKGNYTYYRCTYGKDKNCPQKYYREEDIDRIIFNALGDLYVDDTIVDKIKQKLQQVNLNLETEEKKEARSLRTRETQLKSQLSVLYEDRLNGVISLDEYRQHKNRIETLLADIRSSLDSLGKRNLKMKEEGLLVLELLKNLKTIYSNQDPKGKAQILRVVLDKCLLKGDDTFFLWKPPFDIFFSISRVIKKEKWGE